MKKLLSEPLVQFLLIGGVLFAADLFLSTTRQGGADAEHQIRITEAQGRHLANTFERVWRRPPTADELAGLIEAEVTDELYYREALRLGLDRDDAVVRRRLRQKLELISEDLAGIEEPTSDDLERYLQAHPQEFRLEPRYTLDQVFLNPDERGGALVDDATRLLTVLSEREGPSPDFSALGDSIMLTPRLTDRSAADIARLLGAEFVTRLAELPVGRWAGPVESVYGSHLVRIENQVQGRQPALDEVREVVAREWRGARRHQARQAFQASLRNQYTILIDSSATNLGGGVAPRDPTQ